MNATILACLRANVSSAQTPASRRFAQEQLDGYIERQRRREAAQRRALRPTPNWDKP